MLRSTHKAPAAPPPLPEGWTEHKAPTGHSYYYHAATKKSTYTRPTIEPEAPPPQEPVALITNGNAQYLDSVSLPGAFPSNHEQQFRHANHGRGRNPKEDKPKHRKAIPNCTPWILVTTKFKRRFVYNPELGESFWKFPQDVLLAVAELDRKEAVRKERREKGEPSDSEPEKTNDLDDEYEEVEVTDDEDMEIDSNAKRQKIDEAQPQGPVEFNEDDFAQQLALMEQGEDDDPFAGMEFEEEPPLDAADAKALFSDLLVDFRANPYTPWDQIIENMSLIEDPRYTCLPNMKSRREVFDEWSRDRIAEIKAERERQEKKDPKIGYFALLDQYATPKLYWPEFKRKFKKEQALRETKISEKDKEKWYREHINRLKLSQSTLKADLKALLKEQPLSQLNRSSSLKTLPTAVLTDLRYISLRAAEREPLIEAYIELLDPAPDREDLNAEDSAAASKARTERERRENALRERERKVEEDKKRRQKQERASRGLLKDGEADLERAMNVRRDGLRGHFEEDVKMED